MLCQMVMLLATLGDPEPPLPQITQIFAFVVAIHIFVVGQRRDFKFGTQVGRS